VRALLQQLRERSAGYHLAVLKQVDVVAGLHGREPMGDHEQRLASLQGSNGIHDGLLGGSVE